MLFILPEIIGVLTDQRGEGDPLSGIEHGQDLAVEALIVRVLLQLRDGRRVFGLDPLQGPLAFDLFEPEEGIGFFLGDRHRCAAEKCHSDPHKPVCSLHFMFPPGSAPSARM